MRVTYFAAVASDSFGVPPGVRFYRIEVRGKGVIINRCRCHVLKGGEDARQSLEYDSAVVVVVINVTC